MPNVYDKVTRAERKPDWLKIRLHEGEEYSEVSHIVKEHGLSTICSSGMCPNKAECWGRRTATLMILGETCTRCCKFCATETGHPLPPEQSEPQRVADSIKLMGLKHAVITSVTRDDLSDGGARHWAAVIEAVRSLNPNTTIEVLIPDMDAVGELLDIILAAKPDITGHNIETVRRLTPQVRSRARYDTSLSVIEHIANKGMVAKSGIMVGLGETDDEIEECLHDLRNAGCRIVTLGQYLRPTAKHWPVDRYVTPEQFAVYKQQAEQMGFDYVASAPLVRSSYMAEQALGCCAKR